VAYYLVLRRKRFFSERYQPEVLLGAPLLSAIPDFEDEDLNSLLPVSDAPYSSAAEASRFLASSLDLRLRDAKGRRPGSRDRRETALVAFTSATLGDGKTIVSANAAAASALQGRRVLSVDADFGHQALSEMLSALSDSPAPPVGITEVASRQIELADAIKPIDLDGRGGLHLLSRGTQIVTGPDFFNSAEAQTALRRAGKEFDLVFIDTPPMLEVAYASALLRLVDFVVVVVPHGSPMALVEEMRKRIELIGTPLAGYVYNKTSQSRGVVASEGSMRDVLGNASYPTKTTHSRWQWARPWLSRLTGEEPPKQSSDTVPAEPKPTALSADPFAPMTDAESDGE
jgi:Mrp family chromosome partitioning ATPase